MPPDAPLSVWLTGFAGDWAVLDASMKVVASNYFNTRIAAIVLMCLWFGTRDSVRREHNQKAIVAIAVGALFAFGIAESLTLIQDHIGDFWARPYDSHAQGQSAMDLLYFKLPDSSFPSNAICGIVVIAIGLWFADRRASIFVWAIVLLWGFGRVYVGIHYPLDILGGILIGTVSIILGRKLVRAFDPQVSLLLSTVRRFYLA